MKKITLILFLLPCVASTMYAQPTLEILDKNPNPVWVAIKNGNLYFTKNGWQEFSLDQDIVSKYEGVQVLKGVPQGVPHTYQGVDTKNRTTIALWLKDPTSKKVYAIPTEGKPDSLVPPPDKYWTFTPEKDIFVTLDASGDIRPQTGVLMGLLGKSASGYSLQNNICANDIKPIPRD